MTNTLINQFEYLQPPQVICIGEALLDRLGPLGGDPLFDKPVEDRLGGAPANVACGLAKLGNKAAFCGRLGADLIGKNFQNLFNCRGVNLQGLQIDEQRPSRIVLVHRDQAGERSFQGFIGDIGKGFADQAMSLPDLLTEFPKLASTATWLLVGSIPLATKSSQEALTWSIEKALELDIKLAIDINWRSSFWDPKNITETGPNKIELAKIAPILEKSDLLKLANEEAIWFFNNNDPSMISSSLPKKPDVLITDGSRPVRWCIGGFCGELEVFAPPSVVDTTGAGDAFTAGLLNQFLKLSAKPQDQKQAEQVVRFAAACGALVCGGAGSIDPQPTYDEVISFLLEVSGG